MSQHEQAREQARETLGDDDVGEQDDDDDEEDVVGEQDDDDCDVGEQDDGDDDDDEKVHQVLGRKSVQQGSESQRFTKI